MASRATRSSTALSRGAVLGVVLGVHAWLIGAVILFLATGHRDLAGEVLLVGLPVSLALAAVSLCTIAALLARFGRGAVFGQALAGLVLFLVGVLVLLTNHWLAPRIEGYPDVVDLLQRLQATYRTSDWVPALCLVGAALLLGRVAIVAGRCGEDDGAA